MSDVLLWFLIILQAVAVTVQAVLFFLTKDPS